MPGCIIPKRACSPHEGQTSPPNPPSDSERFLQFQELVGQRQQTGRKRQTRFHGHLLTIWSHQKTGSGQVSACNRPLASIASDSAEGLPPTRWQALTLKKTRPPGVGPHLLGPLPPPRRGGPRARPVRVPPPTRKTSAPTQTRCAPVGGTGGKTASHSPDGAICA